MKKKDKRSQSDFVPAVPISDIREETLDFARSVMEGGWLSGKKTTRVEVDIEKIDQKLWAQRQELTRKLKEKYMEQFDDEDSRELKSLSEKLAKTLDSAMPTSKEMEDESVR